MKTLVDFSLRDPSAIRKGVASYLHDELGQHLIGTLLLAQALAHQLQRQDNSDANLAGEIVKNLSEASADVHALIDWLDDGRPR